MDCPVCRNVTLQVVFRESIEIDYCPKCRGVWLDRGELEKIIERSASAYAPSSPPERASMRFSGMERDRDDYRAERPSERNNDYRREERRPAADWDDRRDDNRYRQDKPKKRGGFLSDLFEFGD